MVRAALAFPLLIAGAMALPAVPAIAAGDEKGPVFIEPPENDPSYQLQGEFVGPISVGENEYQSLGLQVRCLGDGTFEAVSFMGGLPGQDKHQSEPTKMIGQRSGDFLVLSGGPWAVFVEKSFCTIVDRQGNRVGRLERIHRQSPTLGAKPPAEAMVLFDGTDTAHFEDGQISEEGWLMEGALIKPMLQDYNLHVEFRLPYMPEANSQARANSGLYLQSRYECQVLDSFAQDRLFNGCGALYRFKAPDVNMCLPPLVWQTYDVQFTAPRWASDGSKLHNARVTVWLNGVKVQDDVELENKTGAGKPEEPVLLPTMLQDHGDPVRFRNVWLIDRGLVRDNTFPVQAEKPSEAKTENQDDKPAGDRDDAAKPNKAAEASESKPDSESKPASPESSEDGSDESNKQPNGPAADAETKQKETEAAETE